MKYFDYIIDRPNSKEYAKAHSKSLLENILYEYAIKNNIRLDNPIIVGLDLTSQCNLRCMHCFQNNRTFENELSTDDWLNIIDQLHEMHVYQVYLMGGEPFYRKDILKIIEKVKSYNMTLSINTNATLIDENLLNYLCTYLDPKTDYIQVSLEGADAKINDAIRGKGQFNIIKEKIKLLSDSEISVRVNMVITNQNYKYMIDVYKLCVELNVKRVAFTTYYPYKRKTQVNLVNDDDCILAFNRMLEYAQETNFKVMIDQDPICIPYFVDGVNNKFKNLVNKVPKLNCRAGIYSFEIDPKGNIYPCTFLHEEFFKVGNIKKCSLKNIWKDDKKWITILDKINKLNEICKCCEYSSKCKGGCISAGYDTAENIGAGDPRCSKYREEINHVYK